MSIPTDENRSLLSATATLRAKAGKEQELRALLESIIEPTRAEEGNVTYALHQGATDPTVFVFFETWVSQAALDAHLGTPHIQAGLPLLADLLDGDLVITPLNRIA